MDQTRRIDLDWTLEDQASGLKYRAGKPFPFGSTLVPGGVNFSIFSSQATSCTLVLFEKGEAEPRAELAFPDAFRIGHVWSMIVLGLDIETLEYGYRMDGPCHTAQGHRFNPADILLDPYAKSVRGQDVWGKEPDWTVPRIRRAQLIREDFHWEGDRPLELPAESLVIYEMHVRSFTADPSAQVEYSGTYAAIRDKIPYLRDLGINCVELMPVFEFDEFENSRKDPSTGETLYNYWGYSTVGFFAPKAGFAATGKHGMQADELKNLIKELHLHGIEVMLDVVFNHTAEGNEHGPTISFRGIDKKTYYMLTPEGHYYNFSGCGNTLNCNNPVVRQFVLDCLRYWAAEYHIDGFRFDLASILERDPNGAPLPNPPLLESLAYDPILAKCKLVAEAWDAGGLYRVGSFPAYGRWAEWNGKYRDDVRRFLKGDVGMIGALSQRLQGSPDLYAWNKRGASASVNFITCHDGFTLHDLFSYNEKHNLHNGEHNGDGCNDNHSWNCGAEGSTQDPEVIALRRRQIKNAFALLLLSRGIPMLLMGDEMGRTQNGNNNAYCHDNPISWQDWSLLQTNADIYRFAKGMIAFRHAHPCLRLAAHPSSEPTPAGYPEFSWHGQYPWQPDWSSSSRHVAMMISGTSQEGKPEWIYAAFNSGWDSAWFGLPSLPPGVRWRVVANTAMPSPEDFFAQGTEPPLADPSAVIVSPRASLILLGK